MSPTYTTLTHFFSDWSLVSDQAKANAHKSFSFFPSFIFPDCVDWVGYRDCTLLVTCLKFERKTTTPKFKISATPTLFPRLCIISSKLTACCLEHGGGDRFKINEEINSTKKLACCKIVLLDISMFSHIYHVFWNIHMAVIKTNSVLPGSRWWQ